MKKDIEWLEKEVIKISENWMEDIRGDFARGLDRAVGHTIKLINQLDEPETLSQEWIDEHENYGRISSGIAGDQGFIQSYVLSEDLKHLLIPKQIEIKEEQVQEELIEKSVFWHDEDWYQIANLSRQMVTDIPTVPRYVYDWIRENEELNVYGALHAVDKDENSDIHNWVFFQGGINNFAKACIEYPNVKVVPELEYRLKTGNNYIIIKKDGSFQNVNKKNAIITESELNDLPFDVKKAVESGIIEVEKV